MYFLRSAAHEAVAVGDFTGACGGAACSPTALDALLASIVEGLGVHVTLDLAGQARFGPDVEAIDHLDYAVDPFRANAFYAEIRKYWPELPDGVLQAAYSGIRPKLGTPENPINDFVIQVPLDHGIDGLVNLFGIESPGLTASLAIAEYVSRRLLA